MMTFLTLSVALLCSSATQLPQQPDIKLHTANAPQYAGVYHPAYGFRTTGAGARSGPALIYNNMRASGYYAFAGTAQEFIDEGAFLTRNTDLTEQVNGMSFVYCSAELSPNGISTVFRLYDETIECWGPNDWPVTDCSYALTGLPASTNGNTACWLVDLDLTGFECNLTTDPSGNRLFGFSHTWDNSMTGPWLADNGFGNSNSFVWFDTTQVNRQTGFLGCYWFGGGPHLGFACALTGPPAETRAVNASSPGLADSLSLCVNTEVQNGNTVQYEVRDRKSGLLLPAKLWVSAYQYDHHLLSGPLGLDAHLLAGYADRIRIIGNRSSSTGIFAATLAGVPSGVYFAQAATVDAAGQPTAMSNALRHNVF
jgi:hypothetical protein